MRIVHIVLKLCRIIVELLISKFTFMSEYIVITEHTCITLTKYRLHTSIIETIVGLLKCVAGWVALLCFCNSTPAFIFCNFPYKYLHGWNDTFQLFAIALFYFLSSEFCNICPHIDCYAGFWRVCFQCWIFAQPRVRLVDRFNDLHLWIVCLTVSSTT